MEKDEVKLPTSIDSEDTKNALAMLTLEEDSITRELMSAKTKEDYQRIVDIFNMAQGKKNILKAMRWDKILDKAGEELLRRLMNNSDQFDNDTLLKYIQVITGQIAKAHEYVDTVSKQPIISINQSKTEVNVNINRESNENVRDAVTDLLRQLQAQNNKPTETIDATFTEEDQ